MSQNDNYCLNYQSVHEMADQLRGWGVWEQYKWAFNDAMDPWESETKKMSVIKHLNFLMSDSVLVIWPPPFFLWLSSLLLPSCSSRSACEEQRGISCRQWKVRPWGGVIFESDTQGWRQTDDERLQTGWNWLQWILSSWRGRKWFGLIRAHRWPSCWRDNLF